MVPASFIPNKDIRLLREYTRYISKLIAARSSEKNRLQNAFTVCNVALDSVVSDMFGKSATAITDYLVSDDTFSPEHCISLLQGSLKKKADLVLDSILGYNIEDVQKTRITLIRRHIDFINTLIDTLESNIDSMVVQYEDQIRRLCTVPGIKRTSAIKIISEIGVDMSQFASSRRLCSWAGLSPRVMNLPVRNILHASVCPTVVLYGQQATHPHVRLFSFYSKQTPNITNSAK